MRPLSQALSVLIATAEDVMKRPQDLPSQLPETFAELADDIRRYDAQPTERVRTTRAAVVMLAAIAAFFAEATGNYHWQMIVGSLLPLLKRDGYQQMLNEKRASEARD